MMTDEDAEGGFTSIRKPSPFYGVDLVSELEPDWPAGLLEQDLAIFPATATRRFGQLLACAVWHGAMLAPKWWGRWLEAAQRHMAVEGRLWLDMQRIDVEEMYHVASYPRRWFADPMSQLLLLRWRAKFPGDCVIATPDPIASLAAYLDPTGSIAAASGKKPHEMLLKAATLRWRLQAPGVVIDYACGTSPALSLPTRSWHRVLTDRAVKVAPRGSKSLSAAMPTYAKQGTGKQDPGKKLVTDLYAAVKNASQSTDLQSKTELRNKLRKALASMRYMALPESGAQHLVSWVEFLIYQKKAGTENWRFQPGSVLNYLSVIRRHIFRHDGVVNFATIPAPGLENFYAQVMDKIPPGSQRNTLVNALRAFQEYLGSCRPELALPLDRFNSWRSQTPVSVGIISSQEYQRALKKLGLGPTLDTRMLRIMLILGFRTGLRFHEIFGLTVNDFIVPDDVEANDAFEMIVRRNRERHTKTELSRRILPLHLLLNHESSSGISELVEVRMWVDHRRKEAELTGRNRMFVNPAWPSVRPPHIATKSRLSVLLKDVSGDERVSFDTLRHSFTSYLLTTMLLPDDAGITLFPLAFTPDLVSASRRERVAGSLLGEGRIGQASVHAVSQLCGHAPVSTTLQWYSHLLDWTLGAYVDRRTVQVGLTFGDAAGHTTMTVAALRKLVQRSRGKAVSQLRLTRGQSEPYRPVLTLRPERGRGSSQIEKPCSVYLDEVLIAATRKIAKDAHAAGTPIVVWSERVTRRPQRSFKIVSKVAFRRLDWRHIKASLEADRMGYDIENFARRENYPYPMLEGWIVEARRFRSARRPDGRLRHLTANANCKNDCDLDGSFPRPPAKGHETRVADRLWSAATGLSDPRLQKALAIFRDCYDGQRNEIQPTTLADARSLAGLLTSLELTLDTAATAGSEILVRHYPGHAKTTESRENILAMLAGAKKSGGRWHGRLTFTPVRKASEGTGYGLRFILTMLTIALGRHDDVQEGLFIKGFSEKRNPIERGETDLMQKGEWVRDYPLDTY